MWRAWSIFSWIFIITDLLRFPLDFMVTGRHLFMFLFRKIFILKIYILQSTLLEKIFFLSLFCIQRKQKVMNHIFIRPETASKGLLYKILQTSQETPVLEWRKAGIRHRERETEEESTPSGPKCVQQFLWCAWIRFYEDAFYFKWFHFQ